MSACTNVAIFLMGLTLVQGVIDVQEQIQKHLIETRRVLKRNVPTLERPRRLNSPGQPCLFANSKCDVAGGFGDAVALSGNAQMKSFWASTKACMVLSSQATCDAVATCKWKSATSRCDVSESVSGPVIMASMAPMISNCGPYATMLTGSVECEAKDKAGCEAASTCKLENETTPVGGACVKQEKCSFGGDFMSTMCGADSDYTDAWGTGCMTNHTGDNDAIVACIRPKCDFVADMYDCMLTTVEATCTGKTKCEWSANSTACGFNMMYLFPDGCAMRSAVSCGSKKTESECSGDCSWKATEEKCDDGEYKQGECGPSMASMYGNADKSQKALADLGTVSELCQAATTESACKAVTASGLLGDYSSKGVTSAANSGVWWTMSLLSLAVPLMVTVMR